MAPRLSGYGVRLDIKSTEYKAMDDSKVSSGELLALHYGCSAPQYSCSAPHYSCSAPHYSCSAPHYSCSAPHYSCSAPHYSCSAPQYSCSAPQYSSLDMLLYLTVAEQHSKEVDGEQEIDGFRFGKLKSVKSPEKELCAR